MITSRSILTATPVLCRPVRSRALSSRRYAQQAAAISAPPRPAAAGPASNVTPRLTSAGSPSPQTTGQSSSKAQQLAPTLLREAEVGLAELRTSSSSHTHFLQRYWVHRSIMICLEYALVSFRSNELVKLRSPVTLTDETLSCTGVLTSGEIVAMEKTFPSRPAVALSVGTWCCP